jgi:hypothetical protein
MATYGSMHFSNELSTYRPCFYGIETGTGAQPPQPPRGSHRLWHLEHCMGLEVVVFERNDKIGGVWNVTNPDVRLQKIAGQYHLSDSHVAFPD